MSNRARCAPTAFEKRGSVGVVYAIWSPVRQMITLRGLLTASCTNGDYIHVRPAHGRLLWHYLQVLLVRTRQPQIETEAPDASP